MSFFFLHQDQAIMLKRNLEKITREKSIQT